MKKLLVVAFALACSLTLARTAKAAGTEFGVDDDLTVLGTDGTWGDPDVQVDGLTRFGINGSTMKITENTKGSVGIAGGLQVDGTIYGSSMTLSSELYVNTVAVDQMNVDKNTRILVQDTATGKFRYESLQNVITGGGSSSGGVTNQHLPVWNNTLGKYVDSAITESDFGVNKTMTIDDAVIMNYTLEVKGNSTLDGTLLVKGDTTIGENATPINVAINSAVDANTALKVQAKADGGAYAAEFFTRSGSRIAYMKAK